MTPLDALLRTASSAGGQMLRGAMTLIAARPAAKPLRPRGVVVSGRDTVDLAWAVGTGGWHRFGELLRHHSTDAAQDPLVSFDPVRNTLPGLETPDWVGRLREPAYAGARRSRRP